MIVETIFSTLDTAGRPNFAPMGIIWGGEFLTIRPYRGTHTYQNLLASGYGVANLTDNVLAYVRSGLYGEMLLNFPAKVVPGVVFQETCSWREVEVIAHGGSEERAELRCRVRYAGWQRDFLGFCRAAGAVIEAAILATRSTHYDPKIISERMGHYAEIVRKTGDETEKRALELVRKYIRLRRSND